MRPLIAGNWKMHGLAAQLHEIETIAASVHAKSPAADVLICVPATLLSRAVQTAAGRIVLGGEDCHAEASGPFTGDISAGMLRDTGAAAVIVGHSERRQYHFETDDVVASKAEAALANGITPIVCVGETLAQRDAGQTEEVVKRQPAAVIHVNGHCISEIVVAYEPVWAIGSGLVPSVADVAEVHAFVRKQLAASHGAEGAKMRILYGGSVKPSNAKELMSVPHVNGALVGGASLVASDFLGIVGAYA